MRNDSRDTFGGVTFQLSYKIYAALGGKSQKAMDQTALTMRESESPGYEGRRPAGDRWVCPVVHPGWGKGFLLFFHTRSVRLVLSQLPHGSEITAAVPVVICRVTASGRRRAAS